MPEDRRPPLVIGSTDDAWKVLSAINSSEFDPKIFYEVEFTGWSLELIRLPLAEASSISIKMMRSLIAYQSRVTRSYKYIKYEGKAPKHLPKQDRDAIELNIVVGPNGSVYNADVKKALAAFIRAAADKMESKHLTILGVAVVLIFAVGYFGDSSFKAWVASESASRDLATHATEIAKLSEEETARAKVLGSFVSQFEQARQAMVQIESGYQELLKAAASQNRAKVLGLEIPNDVARQLASNPRRTGEGTRLDGKYEVVDIQRHEMGEFSVELKTPDGVRSFVADARSIFLPDDQIDLLVSSLRKGVFLNVMVNAWQRDGKPVAAEVARVESPNDQSKK